MKWPAESAKKPLLSGVAAAWRAAAGAQREKSCGAARRRLAAMA